MKNKIAWGIMTFLALGIVLVASRYFTFNPEVFFPEQRKVYSAHQTGIMLHILGGVVALAIGPFQFSTRLRVRFPQVHRWLGRIYLLAVLLGGLAGLYMATFAYAGFITSLGFSTLAVLWLTTGFMAYRTIRAGNTVAHRNWMIRNFALTFAAVTLRLEMGLLQMAFGSEAGYQMVAWLCWIPNLIVAEGIIRGWFSRSNTAHPIETAVTE